MDRAIASEDCDSVAEILQDLVQRAASTSIPQSRPCNQSKPWWTEELTISRKLYHRLRRQAKIYPGPFIQERTRTARNTYFRAIVNTKAQHWEAFLASAKEKLIFTAYNYTRTASQQCHRIPALHYQRTDPITNQTEPRIATSFKDQCQALVQDLFPKNDNSCSDDIPAPEVSSSSTRLPPISTESKMPTQIWEWPELTLNEIKAALPDKKTAPGIDQLDWSIIKAAMECIPSLFFKAYNYLFNCGQHPSMWKQAIGIILPKRNKKDYSIPRAYRPISLLPCLSKLLERIFANRLSFLGNTTNNLFHNGQMGGRKQRCAIDAALLLQHFVESNTKRGRIVSTVFLDILGAFDRLQPAKLVEILRQLALPVPFIHWVDSFLSNRTIKLLFNGELSENLALSGTPQGSPISPLLFLLSIRFLHPLHQCKDTLQLSYIDDISISYASTSVDKNIRKLGGLLGAILIEAKSNCVMFDVDKSELIHFTNKREPVVTPLTFDQVTL